MILMVNEFGNAYKQAKSETDAEYFSNHGFRRVEPASADTKPLDEMTVPELKAYAKEAGIELTKEARKDEILAILKNSEK